MLLKDRLLDRYIFAAILTINSLSVVRFMIYAGDKNIDFTVEDLNELLLKEASTTN